MPHFPADEVPASTSPVLPMDKLQQIAYWRHRTGEVEERLAIHDADVAAGRRAANPKERFALDLLLRCARLRAGHIANPI